uniref:Uncharacterized protein n=1 Tax=Anguilla anguilla TaxID=7936 RepID=A0A0E9UZC2_ANGAN
MEDAVENKLDSREWPHQSECPAAWNGSGAVSARQKHKSQQPGRTQGRRQAHHLRRRGHQLL